jgi:hypothetical protein
MSSTLRICYGSGQHVFEAWERQTYGGVKVTFVERIAWIDLFRDARPIGRHPLKIGYE